MLGQNGEVPGPLLDCKVLKNKVHHLYGATSDALRRVYLGSWMAWLLVDDMAPGWHCFALTGATSPETTSHCKGKGAIARALAARATLWVLQD